jgi:hypothetical protein
MRKPAPFTLVLVPCHSWASPHTHAPVFRRLRPALTVQVVQGRATFTGLHIDRQGTGYTLRFTSSLVSSGSLLKPTGKIGQGVAWRVCVYVCVCSATLRRV